MGVPQYGILTTGTGMRSFVLSCVQSIDHVSAISVLNRNRLILQNSVIRTGKNGVWYRAIRISEALLYLVWVDNSLHVFCSTLHQGSSNNLTVKRKGKSSGK